MNGEKIYNCLARSRSLFRLDKHFITLTLLLLLVLLLVSSSSTLITVLLLLLAFFHDFVIVDRCLNGLLLVVVSFTARAMV
jgi:hypothetical protein